ncbi:MAG: hypothetical protein ACXW4E_00140 [Anaerolineales bacterium]
MKFGFVSRRKFIVCGAWLFFSIFLYFHLHLFKDALIDDAFITLRYVKTLLTSGTWGFFPGVIANSATSPLNVILLTMMSLFTGPTVEASLWLYFVCVFSVAFMLARLSLEITGSEIYGWLATFALVFNPLLISTLGLESILFSALFVFALYCYHFQRWTRLAIALGLLTLARAEGVLFFLVFLLFVPVEKGKVKLTILYFLTIAPWYLFSWIYLGSFLPDTFFIKTEQGMWWQWDFFNGVTSLYYYVYPLETVLSFLFLPLAILLFNKKTREVIILVIIGLVGLIHFVGYSFLRVPPFHWYYVPQVITIILFGSLGLGVLYRDSSRAWQRRFLGVVTAICFLAPAFGMYSILKEENFIVREMPIHTNWATPEQYRQIGLWLEENHEGDTMRLVAGEIGALTYYCDCRLLDQFSDRSWLRDYIAERISDPGIVSTLLTVNFAFYSEHKFDPEAYILRAFSGEPNMDIKIIKEWGTSTKWIPHGFLVLSRE